jgi:hypothetical protein
MLKSALDKLVKGYRRAFKVYPAESRFFLFLTGMGSLGLLLQKETLAMGFSYATFWTSFMISMLSLAHEDLFGFQE